MTIPSSGQYGGKNHVLRKVNDPNYANGRVWESFRKDWVWESGVDFNTQPISISGVYVNGVFHPNGTAGAYAFHIDYPLGRVVFDSPINPTGDVSLNYSYRWSPFYPDDVPWFQAIQPDSDRNDLSNFIAGSGEWNKLAQDRIQLPSVVLSLGRRHKTQGMMLGGGQIVEQDVLFDVLCETPQQLKTLRDVILNQDEKSFYLFDLARLASDNRFPLQYNGALNTNRPPSYPELVAEASVSGYRYRFCTFKDTTADTPVKLSSKFYWGTVTTTVQVEMPMLT